MTRKSSRTTKAKHTNKRQKILFSGIIFLIAAGALVVLGSWGIQTVIQANNNARLTRIEAIYKSLDLDDTYQVTRTNVFGDKRPYEQDKSRSYSSEIEYVHADTVKNTVAALDTKIKAAGFSFFEEPYPGSTFVEYHYKSAKGEYVRLNVESKPYVDAIRNSFLMNKDKTPESVFAMDKDAGPANVTIKVNLDDNNE